MLVWRVRAPVRFANTFTSSRFGGNPTPVIVLPRWPSDRTEGLLEVGED